MRTKLPQEPCKPAMGCDFIATDRNRYFLGKLMTPREFNCEQEYFLSRHRMHNRVMHGWGIVCGLAVVKHPRDECRKRWVVVRAGLAIDCCGRELVFPKDVAVELPLPKGDEGAGQAASAQSKPFEPGPGAELDSPFLICLRYTEEPTESVVQLYEESSCHHDRREANRVREVAALEFICLDEVDPSCWPTPEGDMEAGCRDDCDEDLPGPGGMCLQAECPCNDRVPLALIIPKRKRGGFKIKRLGRRYLPLPGRFLTHIVGINWPHGGEMSFEHLRTELGGRLKIRFSRKLLPSVGDATGINQFSFLVQYGGVQQTLEFLPYEENKPPGLEEDQCTAVFTIDSEYLGGRHHRNIGNNMVYVTLKCDFVMDCHGNPVDGNFLRGLLPSGNGVPGGIFESWFFVKPEAGKEEAK